MDLAAYRNCPLDESKPLDTRVLREVCGLFVTGVTIVTSRAENEPVGVTINSFTSVSLEPPLILFCIHRMSRLWPAVEQVKSFAVNILAEDQVDVCRAFARKGSSHFGGVRSCSGRTGVPILEDTLGYLECVVHRVVDGGDHLIVIGRVVDFNVQRTDGPLTFFRSGHLRLAT